MKAPKHIPELSVVYVLNFICFSGFNRSRINRAIADILYGIAVEVVFLVQVGQSCCSQCHVSVLQATVLSLLPFGGWLICLLHMALLYSLYSFEYRWFYQGNDRVDQVYTALQCVKLRYCKTSIQFYLLYKIIKYSELIMYMYVVRLRLVVCCQCEHVC